jgi:transcriptional regulator
MYQPPHFAPPSADAVRTLMREHPLATLVHRGPDGLEADPVPLLYDADDGSHGTLRGHVARMNPLWRQADGQEVLLHFRGPQAYVSPGWYASKAEHGKVVPTWNYVVVNAHGLLRVVDDAAWLRRLVQRLTDTHESRRAQPWAVDDAPADYVDAMLRAIVGIEIRLTRLEGKWKASQNRSAADRAGTLGGLRGEAGLPDSVVDALVREPAPRQS